MDADRIRKRTDELKKSIRKTVSEATKHSGSASANVSGRVNVVAVGNVGSEGSTHHVSAVQSNRIRQIDGETVEESHVSESRHD